MTKNGYPKLVSPEESLALFEHSTIQDIEIAKELHDTYIANVVPKGDRLWQTMSFLSYIYSTGRIQGIREERAKNK